jgi:hypothetical protein
MNVLDKVKAGVNQIWIDFKDEDFCKLSPITVETVPSEGIIFIGLNPSVSDEDRIELEKVKNKEIQSYDLDIKDGENYKYFKKFQEIADELDLTWGHLDLLYVRDKNQNNIQELIKVSSPKGKEFIYRQLMMTKKVVDEICKSNVKMVVVNNSLARDFLGHNRPEAYDDSEVHWMNYNFIWDNKLGTYRYKNIPFFFTSMLTGQRALDNGSFERLKWQLERTKEILEVEFKSSDISC